MPADLPFPASSRPRHPADPARGSDPDGARRAPDGSPGYPPDSSPEDAGRTVRVAWAADAAAVAAVQHSDLARDLTGSGLDIPTATELEPLWLRAITRPPTARHRVLVAVDLDDIRGFVATGPAADPDSDDALDGEAFALHAVRDAMRPDLPDTPAGGGAELLAALAAAAADTLAADGFSRAQMWVRSTDDVLRRVLDEAGWVPDGASRGLASDDAHDASAETAPARLWNEADAQLHMVRLHVGLV